MPGATTASEVLLVAAMAENEFMIPQTVPNRPIKGAVDPTLARKVMPRSSEFISRPMVTAMARSTRWRSDACMLSFDGIPAAIPACHSSIPAAKVESRGSCLLFLTRE
jgi:hypothetical protein